MFNNYLQILNAPSSYINGQQSEILKKQKSKAKQNKQKRREKQQQQLWENEVILLIVKKESNPSWTKQRIKKRQPQLYKWNEGTGNNF